MTDRLTSRLPPSEDWALSVANHVTAMLAYWNRDQICLFANDAYLAWFGKTRDQVMGSTMRDLLGPLYALNLPYVEAVLDGDTQTFERAIPRPDGQGTRESLATYTPHFVDGQVHGFVVHVADVTPLKQLQRRLESSLARVQTLEGLLPICMFCKDIRDSGNTWTPVEVYIRARTEALFSHGICPRCRREQFPALIE